MFLFGTIIAISHSTVPTGYLLCNGSAVWNKGYEILDMVLSGAMEIPSYEELVGMLPKLEIVYPA